MIKVNLLYKFLLVEFNIFLFLFVVNGSILNLKLVGNSSEKFLVELNYMGR